MIVEEAHRQEHTRYSFGHFLPKVVRRAPRSHHSDPLSSHLPLSKQTAVTLPEIEVQKLGREKHEKKTSIVNLPQNPQKERLRHCQVENQVKKSQDRWWEWPKRKRRTEMYIHSSVVKLDAEAVVSSHGRGHHHRHNLPPLAHGGKTVPTHTHPPAQRKLSKQGIETFTHTVMHTPITTVHAVFVNGYFNYNYVFSYRYKYPQSTCAPQPHISA